MAPSMLAFHSPRSSPGAFLFAASCHRVVTTPTSKDVNEILNSSGMLTSNWSNRMAHMDVQLLLLYLSPPSGLHRLGDALPAKHGAAYPTAGYQ